MGGNEGGCYEDECDLHGPRTWNCMFTPDHLKEALEAQQRMGGSVEWNEVVLDLSTVTPAQLPHSILAWFHMGDVGRMRGVQQAFIKTYGLSDHECPLLALNLGGDGPRSR